MQFLFAVTLFASAALLFCVQPLVAKMVLPLLGGSPAVWNTCMVFFQAALLVGYGYAHGSNRWLPLRRQVLLHGAILWLPLLVLPLHPFNDAAASLPHDVNPIPWLLSLLAVSIGLPFLVLSTTGPLLQQWFASTDHSAATDPYSLYAASNLGSLVALLGYPLLLEPNLRLRQQTDFWAWGYILFVLLTLSCAAAVWRFRRRNAQDPGAIEVASVAAGRPLSWARRLRWLVRAFVPSSLMLGVTTYLSTDIAAVPLLWVIPLALYLLSFMLVFARRPIAVNTWWMSRGLPLGAVLLTLLFVANDMQPPIALLVPLHLVTFFLAALLCHGQLADDRPDPAHLTEFYWWLALGGCLGGLFNALIAPLLFSRIIEYPLVLVLACMLRPAAGHGIRQSDSRWPDWALAGALGLLTALLIVGLQGSSLEPMQLRLGVMFGLPAVLCYTFIDRPVRFALGVGAILIAGTCYTGLQGRCLHTDRNFFGVVRVTRDEAGRFHQLIHGNTVHGRQSLEVGRRQQPLSYYYPTGPIGQVFDALHDRLRQAKVGVIGLGAGALAAYAEPGQEWTFYEIDPAVVNIATDQRYFTFLSDCKAGKPLIILGDARLRLQEEVPHQFAVLVLDAFNSDAIPMHLLTREAVRLYLSKLAPDGLLAFHISNRYFELKPVLANLAREAGLACLASDDLTLDAEEQRAGKDPSQWVIMVQPPTSLGKLTRDVRWQPLRGQPQEAVWTDDFSNLLSVFKWDWSLPGSD